MYDKNFEKAKKQIRSLWDVLCKPKKEASSPPDIINAKEKETNEKMREFRMLRYEERKHIRQLSERQKGKSLEACPSDYTVIDIETTGFSPKHDKIIELSALKVRDNAVVERYTQLINPKIEISTFVTNLTGITNEMVATAPKIEDEILNFCNFVGADVILGHNINFDINFIYDVLFKAHSKTFSNDYVCLVDYTKSKPINTVSYKLKTLARLLEIDYKGSHRGLRDCEMAYECYIKISNLSDDDISKISCERIINYELVSKSSFVDKVCVFTGELEKMERKEAQKIIKAFGGINEKTLTKRTNFLIVGCFDHIENVKDDKSNKLKKAEEYILKGQDLQILTEGIFYEMVGC